MPLPSTGGTGDMVGFFKIDTIPLEATGYGFDWLAGQVAGQLGVEPKAVLAPGKYASNVKARSLLCYWGTRELGMTTVGLARRLNLAQPTVSQAVKRGQKIAEELGYSLLKNNSHNPMDPKFLGKISQVSGDFKFLGFHLQICVLGNVVIFYNITSFKGVVFGILSK